MVDGEEHARQHRRRSVQPFLFLSVLMLLYLILGFLLWWFLDWYIDPESAKEPSTAKKDLFQALGFIMASVAGAIGVYFTWRNLDQARESTQRTLWLTEQGQITEQFTRAIDQLGATEDGEPLLEIRIGGIYALERIAGDSPNREDYSAIVDVLTAYVRKNAPHFPTRPPTTASDERIKSERSEGYAQRVPRRRAFLGRCFLAPQRLASVLGFLRKSGIDQDTVTKHQVPYPFQEPHADIRAIVEVVKRREKDPRNKDRVVERYRARLDLRRTDLERADFIEADLEVANLKGTWFTKARLKEADLFQANFEGANLIGANLEGAYLEGTNLRGSNLRGADLRGAKELTSEQLEQALGDTATQLPKGFARPTSWLEEGDWIAFPAAERQRQGEIMRIDTETFEVQSKEGNVTFIDKDVPVRKIPPPEKQRR